MTQDNTDATSSDGTEQIEVGLAEGVTVTCSCGWYGEIYPDPYESPPSVERDCPMCGVHIVVTCEVHTDT